jgi:hypothetical protein
MNYSFIQERRAFTRAKEQGRLCEDLVLGWPRLGRFALSDGASISYDSRGWARTLCWQFMRDINVGPDWLERARTRFAACSTPAEDDWAAILASDRGSFATFLGITVTASGLVVHAIGDTVLFAIWPNAQLTIYPQLSHADFAGEPVLLCSVAGRGAFPDTEDAFSDRQFALPAPSAGWSGTKLIAVTDALAEWVVRTEDNTERVEKLEEIGRHRDRASFDAWVAEAIAVGELRRDDCSMLIISL